MSVLYQLVAFWLLPIVQSLVLRHECMEGVFRNFFTTEIGHLLHSVNLKKSFTTLTIRLRHSTYPLQYAYDSQCPNKMTIERMERLIKKTKNRFYLRYSIIGPECLMSSKKVVCDLFPWHLDELPFSFLEVRLSPRLREETFKAIIKRDVKMGSYAAINCSWARDLPMDLLFLHVWKETDMWQVITPDCFTPEAKIP